MSRLPCLVVIGSNGSGKTALAQYAKEKNPAYVTIITGLLWDVYARRIGRISGKESLTHNQRTDLSTEITSKYGEDFILNILAEELSPGKQYIIDGIRQKAGLAMLRRYFGEDVVSVGLKADLHTRLKRVVHRDDCTEESFLVREKKDSIYHTDELVEDCDVIIRNDSNILEPFHMELDHLIESL